MKLVDSNLFLGRKLLIVTKHRKEQVIRPILERELGVKCMVTKGFDTDVFGTFSGSIQRTQSAIETARQKCVRAMAEFGADLAVSSEGSFGNHPFIPFAVANEEIILLRDQKNNLEIIAKTLSTNTNFAMEKLTNIGDLEKFLDKAGYPQHGVIFKPNSNPSTWRKCAGKVDKVKAYFNLFQHENMETWIETDMRAMRNPTRMSVIEDSTKKLIELVRSTCPQCNTPGFKVTDGVDGLPCKICNQPTKSTLEHISTCQKCNFTLFTPFPFGKETEDPMYCDYCNP